MNVRIGLMVRSKACFLGDLLLDQRRHAGLVGFLDHRGHDEGGEEEGEADQDGIRRRLLNPMALRRNDSTTTIRVNEVTMIRIDGARLSTVSSAIELKDATGGAAALAELQCEAFRARGACQHLRAKTREYGRQKRETGRASCAGSGAAMVWGAAAAAIVCTGVWSPLRSHL